jgi:hypothetical protein
VVEESVQGAVDRWIAELSDGLSLSSTTVQDRLFDLWGMLEEGEVRREVERWLTQTLDRHLYTSSEIISRLRGLTVLESVSS